MEGEEREVERADEFGVGGVVGKMKKVGKRGERMSGVEEFFIINCGARIQISGEGGGGVKFLQLL